MGKNENVKWEGTARPGGRVELMPDISIPEPPLDEEIAAFEKFSKPPEPTFEYAVEIVNRRMVAAMEVVKAQGGRFPNISLSLGSLGRRAMWSGWGDFNQPSTLVATLDELLAKLSAAPSEAETLRAEIAERQERLAKLEGAK